jgi:hypothetical protein
MSLQITAVAPAPAASGAPARLAALDYTKGVLVLVMVLYHWLNYFVDLHPFYYRYLRFLTPSFIFVTGLLIAQVYSRKYRPGEFRVPSRLLVRGVKLLAIFAVLNLALSAASAGGVSSLWQPGRLAAIFIVGDASGRQPAAFSILVPIAYLLILSAGLLILSGVYRPVFHAACLILIGTVLVLGLTGHGNAYLELLSMGLAGASVGYVSIGVIESWLGHRSLLVLLYGFYIFAISVWNEIYILQLFGVAVSLAVIYVLGRAPGEPGCLRRAAVLLGQYSLIGYIAQIAILQVLRALGRRIDGSELAWALAALVAGIVLTYAAVALTHSARRRNRIADSLYSAVFG